MIVSFRHRGLKRFYESGARGRIHPNHVEKIELILADLAAAQTIDHLRRPGYRLHALKGSLAGFYAIDVTGNWRIVFRFIGATLMTLIVWTTTDRGLSFMHMKNPPHPGKHVRMTCLEPLGISVTAAARALGVSRQAVNNMVNEKAGISPEMAIRLEKMGWGTAEGWLQLQLNYDLSRVRRNADNITVQPFV